MRKKTGVFVCAMVYEATLLVALFRGFVETRGKIEGNQGERLLSHRLMENVVLLVDDNRLNNFINRVLLQQFSPEIVVYDFESAKQALAELSAIQVKHKAGKMYLFLDINMPEMDGFCFLDAVAQTAFRFAAVVMLSSTINAAEIQRACGHPLVTRFISKPLAAEHFPFIFGDAP